MALLALLIFNTKATTPLKATEIIHIADTPTLNKTYVDTTKTDSLSMILLNDGTDLIGVIQSQDMREVTIRLTDGRTVIIPSYTIKKIAPIERNQKVGDNIYYPNPHPSRYLYTPTAYPIKKGEGYFQSVYFLSLQFQYGITDNFSAGVGVD